MTLEVWKLVFINKFRWEFDGKIFHLVFINKFPCDFDGEICHLCENVQNRLQNKKTLDGVRKLASKPYFQAKFEMAAMKLFLQSICFLLYGYIFVNN